MYHYNTNTYRIYANSYDKRSVKYFRCFVFFFFLISILYEYINTMTENEEKKKKKQK